MNQDIMAAAGASQSFTIGGKGGLQAEILSYGATLRRLVIPGPKGPIDLILSLPDAMAYAKGTAFLGALVGRCANRIAGARFTLDGKTYQLAPNNGPNLLHGGARGFSRQLWQVADAGADAVTLTLRSPDGDQGFPGAVEARVRFAVNGATLSIAMTATTDAPTIVNLTTHPYFNLSGDPARPAVHQTIAIAADSFLPTDATNIPTGALASVTGTPFDLRQETVIAERLKQHHEQLRIARGFDHTFVLNRIEGPQIRLHSPDSGATLLLTTDQPGVQFYTGQNLGNAHPGVSGVCLEPQGFPDAINHPTFPSVVLRPGQTYAHRTSFAFSV